MFIDELISKKRLNVKTIGKLGDIDNKTLTRLLSTIEINNVSIFESSFDDVKDKCWLGKINPKRRKGSNHLYISLNKKSVIAHRLMYHNFIEDVPLFNNKIKENQINHKCSHENNGRCVNPWHLYLGSHKSNVKDSKIENSFRTIRHPGNGEKHHNSRLTDNDVVEIRKMYTDGYTILDISQHFKICKNYAGQLIRGDRRNNIK